MSGATLEPVASGLRVCGALDFDSVTALGARGSELIRGWPETSCVVDLSAVTESGSAGLALLLSWLRAARAAGKQLQVVGAPDGLRSVAAVSGLHALLPDAGA